MAIEAPRRTGRLNPSAPSSRRSREQVENIVLQHLTSANAPIGAYEIAWRATLAGEPIVPNQVYRTLSRLISEGRVSRLESLSAYMPKTGNGDACLICDRCHAVNMIDVPDILMGLERCAQAMAFRRDSALVEIHGCCADCLTSDQQ